jgi:hypothetical protein
LIVCSDEKCSISVLSAQPLTMNSSANMRMSFFIYLVITGLPIIPKWNGWWSLWFKIGTNSYLSSFSFINIWRATYEARNTGLLL